MRKNLQQEHMIWLQSSTGAHQLSLIFQYDLHLRLTILLLFEIICLTQISLQISDYEKEIEIMQTVTKEEYLASLRRYLLNLIFNQI